MLALNLVSVGPLGKAEDDEAKSGEASDLASGAERADGSVRGTEAALAVRGEPACAQAVPCQKPASRCRCRWQCGFGAGEHLMYRWHIRCS
jgi:hypothetical protein